MRAADVLVLRTTASLSLNGGAKRFGGLPGRGRRAK
jgi:hypothetical protein